MVQSKARAVELWDDMRWVIEGMRDGTVGMECGMLLAELWCELKVLEQHTGLCLCRACAPKPYRVSR